MQVQNREGGIEKIEKIEKSAPLVMAIVNCNGDSFYAPSRAADAAEALEKALAAEAAGADIIDFGAESTRPGAAYIPEAAELERVLPVVERFRARSALPVSVDTRKAAVARAVLAAGASIINDISALEDDPAMGEVCAAAKAQVVLMHKRGVPATMQHCPHYRDAVAEVIAYLQAALQRALSSGIAREHIILDPGIGFGKNLTDNLSLIKHLAEIAALGYPVLLGLSRKTFLGGITGRDVSERLAATLAANAAGVIVGANILRVHDVKETVDLVRILHMIRSAE